MSKFTAVVSMKLLESFISMNRVPQKILILAHDIIEYGLANSRELIKSAMEIQDHLYVILDNSISEHKYPGDETLKEIIESFTQVNLPFILCLPDVLQDAQQTILNTLSFLKRIEDWSINENLGFMFIPQGSNFTQFKKCVDIASTQTALMEKVTLIGIPRNLVPNLQKDRVAASLYAFNAFNKPLHLLGFAPEGLTEGDQNTAKLKCVKSIDSAVPLRMASKNIELTYDTYHACLELARARGDWFESATIVTNLMLRNIEVANEIYL